MVRVVLLGFALVFAGHSAVASCQPDRVSLRGNWGEAHFSVEIADDPAERARGLMFRKRLPRSSGMLFVYERPQVLSFWMKNTLIELDMLFIDAKGTVRYIHHRAQPGDLRPHGEVPNMLAVLEINGGLARSLGIKEGTEVRHPSFANHLAAWPCSEPDP